MDEAAEAAAASATARAAAHAAARAASHAAAQAATHAVTQAALQAAAVKASLLRQQQLASLLKQRRRSAYDTTMEAMLAEGEDKYSATVAALAAADAVGPAPPAARRKSVPEQQEDAATRGGEEDESAEHAEIYTNYLPLKVQDKFPSARPHPDPIVETSSLSGVVPPNITYQHHLEEDVVSGRISNAQLETVVYAMMRFQQRLEDESRAGFFLGDGAGVGKGRQIAALIKEFRATGGKRVLWVSTSADLRFDARRDLTDMRCPDVEVFPRAKNSLPKGDLSKLFPSGVLFVTYSLLVRKNGGEDGDEPAPVAAPVARRTKAQTLSDRFPAESRLTQIVNWLGEGDGECLIILDECHKAKNLVHEIASESTQTGMAVALLQMKLPNARVLYSSATGASEPRNLLYMLRLGTFRYESITDMVKDLTRSGLGALELFCIGLKANGTYLSRTLSYEKAEFIMEQVQIDHRMQVMYDRSTQFWTLLFNILKKLPKDVGQGA
ncbi:MAG: hypothetical protein WDW38_009802 [Sanguina aurantia]